MMDPPEMVFPIRQVIEATQDMVVDLVENIFETKVILGLILELKSLLKIIRNVIS